MENMSTDEIRERIQKEIAKTEAIIEEYKEMTKPVAPENAIGRLSRMDAINNKAVTEAALRQAEDKLSKLNYVLTKAGDEDFGICKKCQRPIPVGRILLMPHSFFCVQCAR
jgi:DnaK suppressor protein